VAVSSGASPEVIKSLESALELIQLREDFAHQSTSEPSKTLHEILEETYKHDWKKVHQDGKSSWRLSPVMMSGPLEGNLSLSCYHA
jgi:hypothetical protein